MNLKKKFEDNRPIIIGMELAGLWHDIGKLSSIFLVYRQKWQRNEDNWNFYNDPHCDNFLEKYDTLIKMPTFQKIQALFSKDFISGNTSNFEFLKTVKNFTIQDCVHYHDKTLEEIKKEKPAIKEIIKVIKSADSYDAAWDRNNPLFYTDQTKGDIFETNVYGKEYAEDKIDIGELDKKREGFYNELSKMPIDSFPNFDNKLRREVLDITKRYSHRGTLSVTSRPDNDTSLWEHCYAVASLVKVILGHYLIYEELLVPEDEEYREIGPFGKVRFGIFGVGWDGISFMAKGQRIGDILGRKDVIDKLKEVIKDIVEYEYCLGNCIYEDDDGIYFLIPALLKLKDNPESNDYKQHLIALKGEIIKKALEVTKGDLMPHFYPSFDRNESEENKVVNTKYITNIDLCIKELRKIISIPVSFPIHRLLIEDLKDDTEKKYNIINVWQKQKEEDKRRTICPVCQQRPVREKTEDICDECWERRKNNAKRTLTENYTPFTSEIILASPKSNKLCLIVARFGLENWLNGKMIRTLFVKNAPIFENEVAHLGEILDFVEKENRAKNWIDKNNKTEYNYKRIEQEITVCYEESQSDHARNVIFLYDRRNKFEVPQNLQVKWDELKTSVKEEYDLSSDFSNILENALCAKTPTPSTVLDVWMTTQEFNKNITELMKLIIPPRPRFVLIDITEIQNITMVDIDYYSIYEGNIGNISCEVVFIEKDETKTIDKILIIPTQRTVEDFKNCRKIEITQQDKKPVSFSVTFKNIEKELYYPFRVITQSPELFLAIVPADKALEVSNAIYRQYLRDFGKVIGRLPFSLGNIFFNQHMPMFIVLDSARRLLKTFEEKSRDKNAKIEAIEKNRQIKISVSFPDKSLSPLSWELPYRLGNCEIDFHHPFFIIAEKKREHQNRKSYFPTISGEVIHFSEIERCDTIKIYPNYYMFKFLDATARRYELYEKEKRLLVYTLENIEQNFFRLWNFLKEKKISDTTLHNIEELILGKRKEWNIDLDNPNETWQELVKVTIMRTFGYKLDEIKNDKKEEFEFIFDCIKSGLFFDLMELYTRILKRRLEGD